ncbi:MAG: permease-like cell division protein FtsX [bacterium]
MRSLSYFCGQLWINVTRNFLMSAAAMSTAVISLLTLGVFLILVFNINKVSSEITSQLEISVFMNKDLPNFRVTQLVEKIRVLPHVRNIEYVPPETGIKKLEKDLKIRLILNPRDNPLPPKLVVRVTEPKHIRGTAEEIEEMEDVEDIIYGESVIQKVLAVSLAVKFIGFALTILMGLGTLFTIINTIRLTVIARRAEIRTMQLVGATSWFIRWPFLLEGMFFGMTGALISAAILGGGYWMAVARVRDILPFLFPMVDEWVMVRVLVVLLLLCGVFMGIAGSYISVTRFLEEEA